MNLEDVPFTYIVNGTLGVLQFSSAFCNIISISLKLLDTDYEKALIRQLSMYAETIAKAAVSYQVNTIANYLKDLAQAFHQFYAHCKVQGNNEDLRNARLNLCSATRYILADGLALIGSSAPTEMYSEDFDQDD